MLYKLIDPIGIKYSTYYTYACVYIYILMPFVMLTYIIYIYVIICKNDPFRLDMQQIPQPGFLSETLQGVEVGSVAR